MNILKNKFSLLILSFFIFNQILFAQSEVVKETYIFAIKENDTLKLDKYHIPSNEIKPCLMFAFGGAFYTGTRDAKYYKEFYDFFAEQGFVVVAIDYRLGLKRLEGRDDIKVKEMLNIFENTILMAVEDLYSATSYILQNKEEWKINPEQIIISGSSAGGITVLQAEYELCNRSEITNILPKDFKYSGVISFAGAIFSSKGHLKWNDIPAPIQMFHGDADKNVPFNRIKLGKYGFFGSKYIAKKYDKNNFPYYFYIAEDKDHAIAGTPMTDNYYEILTFIEKFIFEKQELKVNLTETPLNKEKIKKNFGIKDYIKSNFN
ncbi:MAG: alpha/beta hydrolase [Bacteroidales bacterium]|jgi:dienelactone hydrolase|nr:alpha/beta hydrolase [Bacteroidales bacterium]